MKLKKEELFDLLKERMPGVTSTLEQCKYYDFEDMNLLTAMYGSCFVEVTSFECSGWQRIMVYNSDSLNRHLLRGEMVKLTEEGLQRDDITELLGADVLARERARASGEAYCGVDCGVGCGVDAEAEDELPFPEAANSPLSKTEPAEPVPEELAAKLDPTEEPKVVGGLIEENLRLADENLALRIEVMLLKEKIDSASAELCDIACLTADAEKLGDIRRKIFLAQAALHHRFSHATALDIRARL